MSAFVSTREVKALCYNWAPTGERRISRTRIEGSLKVPDSASCCRSGSREGSLRLRNIVALGGFALLLVNCQLATAYPAATFPMIFWTSGAFPGDPRDDQGLLGESSCCISRRENYRRLRLLAEGGSRSWRNDAWLLMGDQFPVLVAPMTNKGLLGQEVKGVAGCSYLFENGKLAFRKVHPPTRFVERQLSYY
jgi:hypothetical protein